MSAYTQLNQPDAEARIRRDLDTIETAVRDAGGEDGLDAVYLLGGYARGDGTAVINASGEWRGFNDYDLLLVFPRRPDDPGKYAALAKNLAEEVDIDFVDLGLATRAELARGGPSLFWYEFSRSHRLMWSRNGDVLPVAKIALEELDPLESVRLLFNRGMSLLWAALKLWPEGTPLNSALTSNIQDLGFARIGSHKAVLAAGEARLLPLRWSIRQEERARRVLEDPPGWADSAFLERYRMAVEFRRAPEGETSDLIRLWLGAREDMDRALRSLQNIWPGETWESWEDYRRRSKFAVYRSRVTSPRRLKRWLTGGSPTDLSEPGWFGELPRLLFRSSGEEPWDRSPKQWRDDSRRLIEAWHP